MSPVFSVVFTLFGMTERCDGISRVTSASVSTNTTASLACLQPRS